MISLLPKDLLLDCIVLSSVQFVTAIMNSCWLTDCFSNLPFMSGKVFYICKLGLPIFHLVRGLLHILSFFKTDIRNSYMLSVYLDQKLRSALGLCCLTTSYLSHVMRKPVLSICEQQRCRSACASAKSDQHLCFAA